MTRLAVIVAVAENGVIGNQGGLPWRLGRDLQYFKRVTMAKPILMGRKTYESIGRPLPGRSNIVISRNPAFHAEGVRRVGSLDEALVLACELSGAGEGANESVVIGGAEIYALAIPRAERLYITEVHARVEGDALLPAIDWAVWRESSRERHSASGDDSCDYSFVVYERIGA